METTTESILWVKEGCSRCEAIKQSLAGRSIELRPIEAVHDGTDPHSVSAMAQLAWQDYELPLILLAGGFVGPSVFLSEGCAVGAATCAAQPGKPASPGSQTDAGRRTASNGVRPHVLQQDSRHRRGNGASSPSSALAVDR